MNVFPSGPPSFTIPCWYSETSEPSQPNQAAIAPCTFTSSGSPACTIPAADLPPSSPDRLYQVTLTTAAFNES